MFSAPQKAFSASRLRELPFSIHPSRVNLGSPWEATPGFSRELLVVSVFSVLPKSFTPARSVPAVMVCLHVCTISLWAPNASFPLSFPSKQYSAWHAVGAHLVLCGRQRNTKHVSYPCYPPIRKMQWGLPCGPVDKNPPSPLGCKELDTTEAALHAHRCGGHGFDPRSGRIPHAAEQLGLCAVTNEPVCCD